MKASGEAAVTTCPWCSSSTPLLPRPHRTCLLRRGRWQLATGTLSCLCSVRVLAVALFHRELQAAWREAQAAAKAERDAKTRGAASSRDFQ